MEVDTSILAIMQYFCVYVKYVFVEFVTLLVETEMAFVYNAGLFWYPTTKKFE